MRHARRVIVTVLVLAVTASSGACSSGDGEDSAATTTAAADPGTSATTGTTPSPDEVTDQATDTCTTDADPLRIVLVNDDGVENPAIDVLIDRFASQPDLAVDVTTIAPADERSGSSDMTTPGELAYQEGTTPGGNPAYSVEGFPADAVIVALDELGLEPDLVVSGINPGHNFGPFAALSGTIGVGRTAVRRGIPALAVSAGPELDQAQFDIGADLALAWIAEHCEAIVAGEFQTETVTSINIPACAPGDMGPLQAVPRATELPPIAADDSIFASTCDLSDPAPADDIAAVRAGYPSITQVEPELEG